jgi:hypothetical protein
MYMIGWLVEGRGTLGEWMQHKEARDVDVHLIAPKGIVVSATTAHAHNRSSQSVSGVLEVNFFFALYPIIMPRK